MKTKLNQFARDQKTKNILKLNIRYKEINIKWRVQVTYLACILDESISVQPMTLKAINKTSGESKTFLSKNKLLIPELYKMLFNALIQPQTLSKKPPKNKIKLCKIDTYRYKIHTKCIMYLLLTLG